MVNQTNDRQLVTDILQNISVQNVNKAFDSRDSGLNNLLQVLLLNFLPFENFSGEEMSISFEIQEVRNAICDRKGLFNPQN